MGHHSSHCWKLGADIHIRLEKWVRDFTGVRPLIRGFHVEHLLTQDVLHGVDKRAHGTRDLIQKADWSVSSSVPHSSSLNYPRLAWGKETVLVPIINITQLSSNVLCVGDCLSLYTLPWGEGFSSCCESPGLKVGWGTAGPGSANSTPLDLSWLMVSVNMFQNCFWSLPTLGFSHVLSSCHVMKNRQMTLFIPQ